MKHQIKNFLNKLKGTDKDERTLKELLQELVVKSQCGELSTETMIYCSNLIENALIDAYWDGKISQDRLDHFLYLEKKKIV